MPRSNLSTPSFTVPTAPPNANQCGKNSQGIKFCKYDSKICYQNQPGGWWGCYGLAGPRRLLNPTDCPSSHPYACSGFPGQCSAHPPDSPLHGIDCKSFKPKPKPKPGMVDRLRTIFRRRNPTDCPSSHPYACTGFPGQCSAHPPDSPLHGIDCKSFKPKPKPKPGIVGRLVASAQPKPARPFAVMLRNPVGSLVAPTSGPEPVVCCFDPSTMTIICETDTTSPLHGAQVVSTADVQPDGLTSISYVDPQDGLTKNTRLYPCVPEQLVPECYDVATATLTPSGDSAQLVSMFFGEDGNLWAIVTVGDQQLTVSLCDGDVFEGCCFRSETGKLICPSDPSKDGTDAAIVANFTGPDGAPWVSVAWPGGGARMPLCDEPRDGFCCINLETGLWICPEDLEKNGTAAPFSEVIDDGGYRWAVVNGQRVPVCGGECPPPQLCPTCPAGLWLSPTGECGMPKKEPCCDSCAHGGPCSGCSDEEAGACTTSTPLNPNPAARPVTPTAHPWARQRRGVFSRRGRAA